MGRCSLPRNKALLCPTGAFRYLHQFEDCTGDQAFQLKKMLETRNLNDLGFGQYGNNWEAMYAVLREKFRRGTELADALVKTGDSFLLEHNSISGRDKQWLC